MFGLGPMEIGVIILLAVLLFGNRLPKVARSVGSTFVEFKRGLSGASDEIDNVKKEMSTAGKMVSNELSGVSKTVNSEFRDVTAKVNEMTGR